MKTLFLSGFILLSLGTMAQNKKAALIANSTNPILITYVGRTPPVMNAPNNYIANGASFSDSLVYHLVCMKIDSVLPVLGYRRLPEDSVLKNEIYTDIARRIREPYSYGNKPTERPAKGYTYIPWVGFGKIGYAKEYFKMPCNPDLLVVAQVQFNVNSSTGAGKDYGKILHHMECEVLIKSTAQKGKAFKLKATYRAPHNIAVKPASTSFWGYEVAEDISQYQKEALLGALAKLNEDLKEELAEMQKEKEKEEKK